MQITTMFAPGDNIGSGTATITGVVRSISVGRFGDIGYWVEYTTSTGEVKEAYIAEPDAGKV